MKAFTIIERIIVALWSLATVTTFFTLLVTNSHIGVSICAFTIAIASSVSIYHAAMKSRVKKNEETNTVFVVIAFPIMIYLFTSIITAIITEIISMLNYSGPHFAQASIVTIFIGAITVFLITEIKKSEKTRIHTNSFNDANLAGASFKKCQFHYADFRKAFNVELADFSGSKGLETCVFDTEELKAKVIAQAKESTV